MKDSLLSNALTPVTQSGVVDCSDNAFSHWRANPFRGFAGWWATHETIECNSFRGKLGAPRERKGFELIFVFFLFGSLIFFFLAKSTINRKTFFNRRLTIVKLTLYSSISFYTKVDVKSVNLIYRYSALKYFGADALLFKAAWYK